MKERQCRPGAAAAAVSTSGVLRPYIWDCMSTKSTGLATILGVLCYVQTAL